MKRNLVPFALLPFLVGGLYTAPAAAATPTKSASAAASTPAPASQVLVGAQQVQVPPGADAAMVATQAWAKSGRGQIIMDDDKPLYPYGLMVPTLVCSPGYVCSVNMGEGETPQAVVFGNPAAWQAEVMATAGSKYVVAVRALDYKSETNMLITTDKRSYNIKLKSDRDHYVPAIGFYYPKEQMASWVNQAALAQQAQQAQQKSAPAPSARAGADDDLPSLTAADLNFRYYLDGRDYSWKPVRVYDDGKKTFIEMNPQMQVSAAPALTVISHDGKEQPTNYRVKGNYFIVDGLFEHAALLNGVGRGAERVDVYKGEKPKKLFGLF